MARFLLHIFMAAFAELGRKIIRERVTARVRAARANVKQLGRPKRVFRRDEAIRLREQGMSWRKIAAAFRVPVTRCRRRVGSRKFPLTPLRGSSGHDVVASSEWQAL
jgi:DNA invertase Pin-like site-specific DNA recombinase